MAVQSIPPMSQPVQELTGGTMDRVWYRFLQNLVSFSNVPTSSTAPGTPGQIAYDSSFFYICTAPNTWARVAISAW